MSIHEGHRKRTREEFLADPATVHDHKLLELLLFYAMPRRDTNPVAHELLDRFGSLAGVLDALPDELCKVPGVGESAVALFKAVREAGRRYGLTRTSMGQIVETSEDAYELLRPYFLYARNERVAVLCMDGKGKCLGVRVVSEGTVNTSDATARKVVEAAMALNASQVILAHNHPSGIALPSSSDIATTQHLYKVLRSVEVVLVDHLILVDDDMVSLRDSKTQFVT